MEIAYVLMAAVAFCTAVARTLRARGSLLAWLALTAITFFLVHEGHHLYTALTLARTQRD